MQTIILYENGDTFQIKIKQSDPKKPNKNYIYIDEVLHEVIMKTKINSKTITDEMSENVKPK